MECVQEDRSHPMPCTDADKKAYPGGQTAGVPGSASASSAKRDVGEEPDGSGGEGESEDDLLQKMLGNGKEGGAMDPGSEGRADGG